MQILLTLMEAFCVGVMHRRANASMSAHPGIPDAGDIPSAYWAGYMLTDWFEFDAGAVNAQGYTFGELQRNADALGIDWVSHIARSGDDGRKEAEAFGVIACEADTLDFRAMLAREQYKRFQTEHLTDAYPVIPREFLVKEERMGKPFREHWEEFRPTLRGCYDWLISKGADGREYA